MGFGVFVHRADSSYTDIPSSHYQFPKQYLSRVEACRGDWVVYYEPTKVRNSNGYFAVAKVADVVPDPSAADMYLALIEPGSFLQFAYPVAFVVNGAWIESGLRNDEGGLSGRAQAAVRPLSAHDFHRIVSLGLAEPNLILPRSDNDAAVVRSEFDEAQVPFEVERERVEILTSRPLRDRIFRRVVLNSYDSRCAVTGLKIINGGGRAEVEAAHIRPVEANGPDIVNNGLSLSGTVHWMFDRGLIGLSDDLSINVSRYVNDRTAIESLINPTKKLMGPLRQRDRPHPEFLRWHRENCFKQ